MLGRKKRKIFESGLDFRHIACFSKSKSKSHKLLKIKEFIIEISFINHWINRKQAAY